MKTMFVPVVFHYEDRRWLRGFSLVELMVAMAIMMVLSMVLFSMMGQSGHNYRVSQRKMVALSDFRGLVHSLEQDLSSQVPGTKFLLRVDEHGYTQLAFVRQRDARDSDAKGDLQGCYYYVAFCTDDPHHVDPLLYRGTMDAETTLHWLAAGETAQWPEYPSSQDEPMALHLLQWQIRGLQRDEQGRWKPWNEEPGTKPEQLEIVGECLDDLTAQRLTTESQWLQADPSHDLFRPGAVARHETRIQLAP